MGGEVDVEVEDGEPGRGERGSRRRGSTRGRSDVLSSLGPNLDQNSQTKKLVTWSKARSVVLRYLPKLGPKLTNQKTWSKLGPKLKNQKENCSKKMVNCQNLRNGENG